jgi:hypothetical protein
MHLNDSLLMFWAASVAAVGLCWVGWLMPQKMPVSTLIWPALLPLILILGPVILTSRFCESDSSVRIADFHAPAKGFLG